MSAFDAAVEAGAEVLQTTERHVAQVLTAALPVLLDGLDLDTLATALGSVRRNASRYDPDPDMDLALAVLAYLRDEFGVTTKRYPTLTEDQLKRLSEHPPSGAKFVRPDDVEPLR